MCADEPIPFPPYSRVTGDKKKAGVIRKYGLNMSRQAFREQADAIGFHKVSFFFSFFCRSNPVARVCVCVWNLSVVADMRR